MISVDKTGRIKSIDGWRALAALGVLWTHTWTITHFQSIFFGNINLFKAINIVGSGVHLFFVISGFCMYLVLRKQKHYSFEIFIAFIKKRWIRIAPAFYFACIIIGFCNVITKGENLFPRLLYNFIFLQNHLPDSVISSPFWSLAVEWHFYIILPLLFIIINRVGVLKTVSICCIVCITLNLLHYNNILLPNVGWYYLLAGNLIHFMWGILLCYIITTEKKLPAWISNPFSLIFAIALAYLGKLLFSNFANGINNTYKVVFLSIGPAIMTFGFSWLIYISLKNNYVGNIIGNRIFSALGKISYSFYLWHAFILQLVFTVLKDFLHYRGFDTILLFIATLMILLPVSYLSYYVFESFYLNRKLNQKITKKVVVPTT